LLFGDGFLKFNNKLLLLVSLFLVIFSSFSVFAYIEVVDQKQEDPGGYRTIAINSGLMGQEFTPTMSPLIAVELYIGTSYPDTVGDTITCRIRELTITGTILGTASQSVTNGFDGWLRFDFAPHIPVTPGSVYVIELHAPGYIFCWYWKSGNPYPNGRLIDTGSPVTEHDFAFRTYSYIEEPEGVPSPVGGEIFQIDKLAILTPYIIIIAVLTTATVLIKKRKH